MTKKPIIIRHRANTKRILEDALAKSIDGVEFDLRKTSDGVVVLHHDRRIKDEDARFHWIDKMSFNEVKAILGESLMTFEEAIKIITTYKLKIANCELIIDLDLKQRSMEEEIARIVKKHKINQQQILVCSPDIWILKSAESNMPFIKIGLTYSPDDKYDLNNSKMFHYLGILMYYSLKPFIFRIIRRKSAKGDIHVASIQHKLLSKKVIQFLHQYDIAVYGWGTDSKKKIKAMTSWGIDGIKIK